MKIETRDSASVGLKKCFNDLAGLLDLCFQNATIIKTWLTDDEEIFFEYSFTQYEGDVETWELVEVCSKRNHSFVYQTFKRLVRHYTSLKNSVFRFFN